jgi:hypothetical protein
MNGYVSNLRGGRPVSNYDNPKLTAIIDQLYASVGQHVALDSEQVFSQILPQIQQLQQIAQQYAPAAVLPPDAQVVKDTSMAETKRKEAKDQQDMQLAQAKLQDNQQRGQAEMQANAQKTQQDMQVNAQKAQQDAQLKMQGLQATSQAKLQDTQVDIQARERESLRNAQLQLQLAQMHDQTQVDITNAKLTHETIQSMVQPQGAPDGNLE